MVIGLFIGSAATFILWLELPPWQGVWRQNT